jgi:hypothetical protein
MRKKILFIFMSLYCAVSQAQDKIITTSGDTIFCRILDISANSIHYEQKQTNGSMIVGKFISAKQVREYQTLTSKAGSRSFISLPKKMFRLSLTGGYAHLTSSFAAEKQALLQHTTSELVDKYFNGIKNETVLGADFHVLLIDYLGVGAKYSLLTASAEFNQIRSYDNSYIPEYTPLRQKEKIYINYVGPSFFFRQRLDKKHKLTLNESISLGCAFYREEVTGDKKQSKYPNSLSESEHFAGNLALALEYYLCSGLSISANAGYFYLSFKDGDLSFTNSENDIFEKIPYNRTKAINMSNFHFSVGLQYYF